MVGGPRCGAPSVRKDRIPMSRGAIVATNDERIARLRGMRAEVVARWGSRADRAAARDGQAHGPRASRAPAGPGSFVELDAFVTNRAAATDVDGQHVPRRRRGHRPRHHRRPAGLRLLPGLHGLRRIPVGGLRREDLQDHGSGDEGRRADHRTQRFRRRADPGGRRRRSAATPTSSCATSSPPASSRRSRSSSDRAPGARCTRRR